MTWSGLFVGPANVVGGRKEGREEGREGGREGVYLRAIQWYST